MQNQVTRYKNQVKELEEREDELMKEKRHQAKEVSIETRSPEKCLLYFISVFVAILLAESHFHVQIRSLQSESEDQKTEIDLMKRRIEQLKKRRDYSADS